MKNKAKSKKNFDVKGDKCPREGSMNKQINCKMSEVCGLRTSKYLNFYVGTDELYEGV